MPFFCCQNYGYIPSLSPKFLHQTLRTDYLRKVCKDPDYLVTLPNGKSGTYDGAGAGGGEKQMSAFSGDIDSVTSVCCDIY